MGVSRAALELVLQAKDDASAALKTGKRALKDYGGVATMVATGGMALAAAGAAAIGAAALAASKAVMDFSSDTADAMRLVQAQLGASEAAMSDFRQQAMDVFESGWGNDIEDIADAMAQVNLALGEQGDALEESTRRALILRDVFAIDIRDAVGIAATTVKSGLVESSGEAFDLITTGFRMGLDQAGDFGDTLREYSSDFKRMGFTGEEMLAALSAGLEAGAYNTDVLADGIREFYIRLREAGPEVEEALNILFEGLMGDAAAVDILELGIDRLNCGIENQERALQANAIALEESEGLYAAVADQVKEMEQQLSEAKRQLQDMATPKLEGMDEMGDQIFDVEMAIKAAQLALMDIPKGTLAYEEAGTRVDELNQQLDRLQLERDLTFDRQLREIEKAVRDGTDVAVTYEEAITAIADKKEEIGNLSSELDQMRIVMHENGVAVEEYREKGEQLSAGLETNRSAVISLEEALKSVNTPAGEFFQRLDEGSITGRDALQMITERLDAIEDPLAQNTTGVAMFGTQWEDLGGQVFIAAGQAQVAIDSMAGATDAAGQIMSRGLGASIEGLGRMVLRHLAPLGDVVVKTFDGAAPALDKFSRWLDERIPGAVTVLEGSLSSFADGIMPHVEEAVDLLIIMFDAARYMAEEYLVPALELLWESLGLGELDVESLMEMLGHLAGSFVVTGIKGLIAGVVLVIAGLSVGVEMAANAIDLLKGGLERIRNVLLWVKDRFGELRDAIDSLSLPDWLTPGSPTPFELGLRGIGDALDHLPDLTAQLNVGGVAAPMAMAGAGGGGGVVRINNYFGPGSVRSDEDIEEIARRQEEILNIRGVRDWEV